MPSIPFILKRLCFLFYEQETQEIQTTERTKRRCVRRFSLFEEYVWNTPAFACCGRRHFVAFLVYTHVCSRSPFTRSPCGVTLGSARSLYGRLFCYTPLSFASSQRRTYQRHFIDRPLPALFPFVHKKCGLLRYGIFSGGVGNFARKCGRTIHRRCFCRHTGESCC